MVEKTYKCWEVEGDFPRFDTMVIPCSAAPEWWEFGKGMSQLLSTIEEQADSLAAENDGDLSIQIRVREYSEETLAEVMENE